MKQKFILITIIFYIGCSNVNISGSEFEKQGVSLSRLKRIDNYFNEAIKNNKIPGAVVLVRRNNEIIHNKAYGYSDVENKIPFNTDDIFRIASMTKAITSLGVLTLWEEGKFNLDDPIEKYIPDFRNSTILDEFNPKDSTYTTIKSKNKITIRNLLTHTSGIGYGVIDTSKSFQAIYKKNGIVDLFTTEDITIENNIKKLAKLPLHHEPGENFTYSESIDVLGYFIEVISGKPLDIFFKETIFDPLEMKDTHFYLPNSKADRLIPVQTKKGGFWMKYQGDFYDTNYPISGAKAFFSGGAGLSSTVEDYSKFLQMFLNNGVYKDKQILGKKTVELVYINQNKHIKNSQVGLVFGLIGKDDQYIGGQGSEGTLTWGGYFNTYYFADPVENIIGVLYKQTRDIEYENSNYDFKALVMQSIVE